MTTPASANGFRLRMLRSMLGAHGAGAALAALHPRREALARGPGATRDGPAAVLWEELESMEREAGLAPLPAPAGRTALAFYRRRAALERERRWARAARHLPAPWLGVLRLTAEQARRLCERLGVRVAAAGVAALPAPEVPARLAPLGAALAAEAVAHLARGGAGRVGRECSRLWAQALDERAASLRGPGLAGALGRSLLAGALAALDAGQRESALRLCRSTLCRVLEGERPLPAPGDAAARQVERMIAEATAEARR